MVAKIKNSFLKNSFQLFCYRNYVKDNPKFTTDDDLKRLSNSFPDLYNPEETYKQPEPEKKTKNRSQSANGRYQNFQAQKPVKTHQSSKTLKQLKKKNDSISLNQKSRSKSSQPNLDNNLVPKTKMEDIKPSINFAKNKNSAISSLRISKKLQELKRHIKPSSEFDSSNTNSSTLTTNSILQNPRRRYDTSVGEKKAVRFADSLGLELENVITLNNQLDSQMKYIRLSKDSYMYSPIIYTDSLLLENLSPGNLNHNQQKIFIPSQIDNSSNSSINDKDKINSYYINKVNNLNMLNYAEPRIYSNRSNYCRVYGDAKNHVSGNNIDPIDLYYSFNSDNNLQKISITTRLNNGKLESEV